MKKTHPFISIVFMILLLQILSFSAYTSDLSSIEKEINKGRELLQTDERKEGIKILEKAAEELKKVIVEQPMEIPVVYQLGKVLFYLEKDVEAEEALDIFLQVVTIEPSDWRAQAKLIQLYQATNQLKKRDESRDKLFQMRKAGSTGSLLNEQLYCRDQFSVSDDELMVMEYFDMIGEMAKRYSFFILDDTGECCKYEISLGSYDNTNQIAHETGDIKEGVRLFHLDGYYPDGLHKTFEFFKGEPKYDDVRKIVIDILIGKRAAESSSK